MEFISFIFLNGIFLMVILCYTAVIDFLSYFYRGHVISDSMSELDWRIAISSSSTTVDRFLYTLNCRSNFGT